MKSVFNFLGRLKHHKDNKKYGALYGQLANRVYYNL
jgi:hypothetical protein